MFVFVCQENCDIGYAHKQRNKCGFRTSEVKKMYICTRKIAEQIESSKICIFYTGKKIKNESGRRRLSRNHYCISLILGTSFKVENKYTYNISVSAWNHFRVQSVIWLWVFFFLLPFSSLLRLRQKFSRMHTTYCIWCS